MGAKSDQVKGQAKEMVGTLTGNEDLETEGKADRRAGETKEKVGDAKEKVEEVIDTAKDKVEEAIDRTKDALHPK
ncbi:MAG: CsbD family protein [Acidimicrobiia bacterium]